MNSIARLLLLALTFCYSGCGIQPPKCSDEQTTSLLLKILSEQISKVDGYQMDAIRTVITLEYPVATALDEKVKRINCEALLVVAGTSRTAISYTSMLNDENRHIVILNAIPTDRAIPLRMALNASLMSRKNEAGTSLAEPVTQTSVNLVPVDVNLIEGKHPSKALAIPEIESRFQRLLKGDYSNLSERVVVASTVERIGPYILGSGCMAHACGSEEAAYIIQIHTGEVFAVVMSDDKMSTYGASPQALPPPLRQWYVEHGGTE